MFHDSPESMVMMKDIMKVKNEEGDYSRVSILIARWSQQKLPAAVVAAWG
jgi:hypothetical protein